MRGGAVVHGFGALNRRSKRNARAGGGIQEPACRHTEVQLGRAITVAETPGCDADPAGRDGYAVRLFSDGDGFQIDCIRLRDESASLGAVPA